VFFARPPWSINGLLVDINMNECRASGALDTQYFIRAIVGAEILTTSESCPQVMIPVRVIPKLVGRSQAESDDYWQIQPWSEKR
jgi:hypothetical protein